MFRTRSASSGGSKGSGKDDGDRPRLVIHRESRNSVRRTSGGHRPPERAVIVNDADGKRVSQAGAGTSSDPLNQSQASDGRGGASPSVRELLGPPRRLPPIQRPTPPHTSTSPPNPAAGSSGINAQAIAALVAAVGAVQSAVTSRGVCMNVFV